MKNIGELKKAVESYWKKTSSLADLQKEAQANDFAVEWTFSNEQEEEVLDSKPLKVEKIEKFAKKFNTHPAMIIGRFHHKKLLPYSIGNQFIEKIEIFD